MTAAAALEEQIKRYQRMTGEQRLALALELHEMSCAAPPIISAVNF